MLQKLDFLIFVLLFAFCIRTSATGGNDVVSTTQNSAATGTSTEAQSQTQQAQSVDKKSIGLCPNMLRHVFENSTPRDEAQAGFFEEFKASSSDNMDEETYLWNCLEACCEKSHNNTCNVVLVFKKKCYHIRCSSNEACLPKERSSGNDKVQMVLVNPIQTTEDTSWAKLLKSTKNNMELLPFDELDGFATAGLQQPHRLNFWKQPRRMHYLPRSQESQVYDEDDFPIAEKRMKQLLMNTVDEGGDVLSPDDINYFGGGSSLSSAIEPKIITCDPELGEQQCPSNEECLLLQPNAIAGVCSCMHGYTRNKLHKCTPIDYGGDYIHEVGTPQNLMLVQAASAPLSMEGASPPVDSMNSGAIQASSTPAKVEPNKNIVVSVVSKEVRLPEQEVTLAAFTVPDEQTSNTKYKYLWTLITQPKSPTNGTISDQSKSKVKLTNLSEGLYTFKVSVTGDNGTFGEAMANVTVLPEKRINRVPQVVISPREQTIRQPTMNAVLDGSTSTDDDKIINWHWEVISGPIGYQPQLPEVNTLQLTDLRSPGNYTFKLTITDSNNVTNSTTATIQVLKETDYAPVANAGDAVILYLPNNNVTLNGTASSDDHEIIAWEWTKDASDEAKAVDMQNTRTPYVQLSNLEEGMYTFVLKVTDGSGQSSTAKVHVFVKPPTNSPPVAVAGSNTTTSLPRNWVLLNGSESKDDIGIKRYQWKQLSGPNTANIVNSSTPLSNATSLTLGLYEFELTVVDENNNTASDTTWVKIVQERNAPPVANAGGDHSITLPSTSLYLNGTQSWDDLGIVKYAWTREDNSLAAGVVLGDTDKQPVMILTNLVHGRYVFKLTVSDDQGLTSEDTVSVNVHPDTMLMHLLQMTLPMGISVMTQGELNSIVQKIGLLLGDDMKIQVRELKYDLRAEAAVLVFYVESISAAGKSAPVNGLVVERLLKEKLVRDASILGALFVDIRTTVCQNRCSGHGSCNPSTRACICEAFWMPSAAYFLGWNNANCDWSILYVFVGIIIGCLLLSAIFWGIACACRHSAKKPRSRVQKVQKYSLIGTQDEEAANYARNTSLTESDTDSDVLFETRGKSNGILRMNGTNSSNNVGKHNKQNNSSSSGSNNISQSGNSKYAVTKLGRKIKA